MARHRAPLAVVTVVTLAAGAAGCAGFRTERRGRDVGRAICDVKSADDTEEVERALQKLDRRLDRATQIVGRRVSEDVRDIAENVDDLSNHVEDGRSELAEQDVALIRRNVQEVVQTAPALTKRFYEGVTEGLGDCT